MFCQWRGNRGHPNSRGRIYRKFANSNPSKVNVRTQPCINSQPGRASGESSALLRKIIDGRGGDGAATPDDPIDSDRSKSTVAPSTGQRKTYLATLLEGSKSVVRDGSVDPRQVSRDIAYQDSDLVGAPHKNVSLQSLPPVNVYGSGRSGNEPAGELYFQTWGVPANVSNNGIRSGSPNKAHFGGRIRDALCQEGGDNSVVRRGRKGGYEPRGSTAVSEASVAGVTPKIQCRPRYDSASAGYAERDKPVKHNVDADLVFRKFLEDIPHEKVRHTITRTRRTSKVALPKDFSIPLHVRKGIPRIEVQALRNMMNETAGARFDETWNTLLSLPGVASRVPTYRSFLPEGDVKELVDAGFVSRVDAEQESSRPTMDWVIPFTVVEPADDGSERRRFIAWTQEDNERIKESYVPYVPVRHAAFYLHRAKEQSAVKRDLACGFWQVAIPLSYRQKIRFVNKMGDLYEMTVMPMGHRCAPELMHALTATLAGDREYCENKMAFFHGGLDTYIDGIRFAGNDKITNDFARFVDDRIQHCRSRAHHQVNLTKLWQINPPSMIPLRRTSLHGFQREPHVTVVRSILRRF